MQKIDIIFKSITLLYRESFIQDNPNSSNDLVRTVMKTIVTDGKYMMMGGSSDVTANLKKFTLDLCNNNDRPFDKEMIRQSVALILGENTNTLDILMRTINEDLETNKLNRVILTLKRYLNNYYKEYQISDILSNAHYRFKNNRSGIKSTNDFINNMVSALESLELTTKSKDPAIANEIDLGDDKSLDEVMEAVKDDGVTTSKLKTGWQALNRMTSGGFKRGETVTVGALQHKYKSGFTLSLFAQLAVYNKPQMLDETKKPLMLLISLEDDMSNVVDFLYRYLYNNEHNELPDFSKITAKEASKYVQEKLGVNGYHVKMLRVDPTAWSFKHLFNKIIEYEAACYELHSLFIDYLSMIPTIGCITTGPGGTDLRDLFRRVRNFCAVRKILHLTPHQLSTEAKQLIRNGVPDATFVKEISGKGYYSGSRQLDQEIDLELYIHIAKINGKPHLTVQRGKHRGAPILDEKFHYFALPFPKRAPILDDVNGDDTSYSPDGGSDDGGFEF